MTKVIIDTCAWIDFFRNQTGVIGDAVSALVERDQAIITGPVLAELLQGLNNRQEGDTLGELLDVIPFAEVIRTDWEETGALLCKLRQRGTTVPLTDALIAVIARRNGYAVLTLDRHFEHLEVPLHPF
jgi:predicted nucleic acid-binding protein